MRRALRRASVPRPAGPGKARFEGEDDELLAGALAPLADCWHRGGGPWFLLFPLFWIAVVVFVIWLVRRRHWGRSSHWHRESAVELLEGRFARGEIDDDEYRRRRSVLGGDGQSD